MSKKLTLHEWRNGQNDLIDNLQVTVDTGRLCGFEQNGARVFLGVPYAAPPVGDLRWRPPQPPGSWQGTRDALSPGDQCCQPMLPLRSEFDSQSEDCLYLNITTPLRSSRWPLPVMVWLHGGGFVSGAGSDYDCARMALQGEVMVVTVNYRLGALGFFGYPGLEGSGQFGLMDQQAALAWVRRNASTFGGDPTNVTLFGESAGGHSTALQLISPQAAGLFDRAILQSASPLQSWERHLYLPETPAGQACVPIEVHRQMGLAAAVQLGCGDLAALRRIPPADLMQHFPSLPPAYGEGLLPEDPATALREGRFQRMPIMWGGTREEARLWVSFMTSTMLQDPQDLQRLLDEAFGENGQAVASRYPVGPEGVRGAWARISSDRVWSNAFYKSFEAASRAATVYAFEFADDHAPSLGWSMPPDFPLKAGHSSELAYLFDIRGERAAFTAHQIELADQMVAYWTNFAAQGDPNGVGLPAWRTFEPSDKTPFVMGLEPDPTPFDFRARHQSDFWATIP